MLIATLLPSLVLPIALPTTIHANAARLPSTTDEYQSPTDSGPEAPSLVARTALTASETLEDGIDAVQQESDPPALDEARSPADEQVERLLASMSPADRVGQLFVVSFTGDEAGLESGIADLIVRLRVGGVVLDPLHENFSNDFDAQTSAQVAALTNQLQALAYNRLLPEAQALDSPLLEEATTDVSLYDALPSIVVTTRTVTATQVITLTETPTDATTGAPANGPSTPVANQAPVDGGDSITSTASLTPSVITRTEVITEVLPMLEATSNPLSPTLGVPLFVGLSQAGDGWPATALRSEAGSSTDDSFVPLPPQMAIGATWNLNRATQVGAIAGEQLSAVGVNLLLGPSLDLIEQPVAKVNGIGVQSFGSNPYWVSQMSRAYIAGVHTGSAGGVATIVHSFPGQGGSDRPPGQEVATIQKSLDELRSTSLQPFFAVTRLPAAATAAGSGANGVNNSGVNNSGVNSSGGQSALGVTDGLMTATSRYLGLQNTVSPREPFNVSPGLTPLLQSAEIAPWRQQGLVVSDALGLPAIRRYYDPTLQSFPARQVAVDAFTAGHDLLYLDQFSADGDWASQRANIEDVINLFRARYTDPNTNFSNQVDARVRRILRLKLELYGLLADETPVSPLLALDELSATAPLTAAAPLTDSPSLTEAQPSVAQASDAVSDALASVDPSGAALDKAARDIPLSTVLTPASARAALLARTTDHLTIVNQVANESITALYLAPLVPNGEFSSGEPTARNVPTAEDTVLIIGDARSYVERLDGDGGSLPGGELDGADEAAAGTGSVFASAPNGIVRIIERLFGRPGADGDATATGQINPETFSDWTFQELDQLLDAQAAALEAGTATGAAADGASITATAATTDVGLVDKATTGATTGATDGAGQDAPTAQPPTTSSGDGLVSPITDDLIAPSEADAEADAAANSASTRPQQLAKKLTEADWIIFAMMDVKPEQHPHSDVVKRFLDLRGDEFQDRTIIVLALNAPYFLDATEVSLLDAYYGVYSKTEPFLENAVEVLFSTTASATGAPPVSVDGTQFNNLAERLSVAPGQLLGVRATLNGEPVALAAVDNADSLNGGDDPVDNPQAFATLEPGDVLSLEVGPILDLNGHPVPNTVAVNFQLRYEDEATPLAGEPVRTNSGLAVRTVVLERGGLLHIDVQSGAASAQYLLNLQTPGSSAAATAGLTNTETSSSTVANGQVLTTATGTAVDPPLAAPSETTALSTSEPISPAVGESNGGNPNRDPALRSAAEILRASVASFAIALLTIMITVFVMLILQVRILTRPTLVNQMLWAIVAGLAAYIVYSVGFLPNATLIAPNLQPLIVAPVVFIAMLLPLLWLQLRSDH